MESLIKETCREKGLKYLFRKAIQRGFHTLIYIFIRILRPFKYIRVGSLYSKRIGHFAANTELYLCEKDHHLHPENTIDIFFHGDVCNHQLLRMWKRVLHIHMYARYVYDALSVFDGFKKHTIESLNRDRDVFGLLEKSEIHLSFTREEIDIARTDLNNKMGIKDGIPYVCILGRDIAFLNRKHPERDFSYHYYRSVDIQNFVSAAETLTSRGYRVIRMGSEIQEIMKTNNPQIIEYAHRGFRTELLDIYLPAHCHFFVSCGSGVDAIAEVFRRPMVYVNYIPLEHINTWRSNVITIFKKYWLVKEKRFMTAREILESGAGRFLTSKAFSKHEIEPIENTPEEIADAVEEMDARLAGSWEATAEDEELQQKFWSFFKPSNLNRVFRSRIGTKYLRNNLHLLD